MGVIHSFSGGGGDGLRPKESSFLGGFADRCEWMLARHRAAQVWKSFESQCHLGPEAKLFSTAACCNLGQREDIRIGAAFTCRGTLRREAFGGRLHIGDNTYLGDYSLVSCGNEMSIGSNVLIAFNVCIFDNDSHPLDPSKRLEHSRQVLAEGHFDNTEVESAPVRIEDDVWIGFGSTVLKGVTIGAGAVVGAGSIVTGDVPPRSVVAGNPARVIREIG